MKQISSLDLYYLVREFKILENQRIDSFYFESGTFYIKVYVKQKGNKYLTNKVSKFIYLGNEKKDSSTPPNFIQYLRKYLKNAFIETIEQMENERILKIIITKKNEKEEMDTFYIFIELFSNGNVILTDENLNIKNSLTKKTYKDRSIKVHEKYELPPQKEISIFNLDKEKFISMFEKEDLEIVKFLATRFGIGGKFAEEVCFKAKIDKNAKDLKPEEFNNLIENLKKLPNEEVKSYGVYKNEELIDFIPFDFSSIIYHKKEFTNFNDVIKTYFEHFLDEADKHEEELKKELEKLKRRLKTQQKQKEMVLKDYEKYNEIGNKIYEHYSLIEELLESINKASKEKGWDSVKKTIKENEKLSKIIKVLNYKNNEIILNLE
ncbi:MAG: NFACT family protein [Candidatus Woesearchaeota archaeon]|jgi:predicted ribosome quality control (RQC) complex YloA/Tae2 family protein|nr:NFACT family protein [Candidatus Woesearchaeota archaeon]